jgi:hypothetical protein
MAEIEESAPMEQPVVVSAESLAQTSQLEEFLIRICPLLLDCTPDEEKDFTASLKTENSKEIMTKFISENKSPVLFLEKIGKNRWCSLYSLSYFSGSRDSKTSFILSLEIIFHGDKNSCLAFIKKQAEGVLDKNKSVGAQLQMVHLGAGSVFETLHNYIHNTFNPFFRSYLKHIQKDNKEQPQCINIVNISQSLTFLTASVFSVSQRMTDLEVSLLNCKQSVQIDSVTIQFHPKIVAAAAKVYRRFIPFIGDYL